MIYGFTYEVTSNCNYKCDYCYTYKNEEFSDLYTINKILEFFRLLSANDVNDTIQIQLFGGECTLHPHFIYIVEELSKLPNVKFILFTNFSADLDLYKQFCEIAKDHIWNISPSFHYHHISTEEFLYKLRYLVNNYDVNYNIACSLAKNRYTEEEYINIFSEFKNNKNITLSLFPLIKPNLEDFTAVKHNINKNNNINIIIDKNTLNKRYHQYCDCYITNAYINSKGILSPCFQYLDICGMNLLTTNKILNYYKILTRLKFTCNKPYCYRYTDWVDY
jgi:organic radical activating enzyme